MKALFALTPYRLVRQNENRFQSIPYTMMRLRDRGYMPGLVIDCGAHAGEFSVDCGWLWPDAAIHMIEPQGACWARLATLPYTLHRVAVTAVCGPVEMTRSTTLDTGAHIWAGGGVMVQGSTLDALFKVAPADRALLKMDLQGHELEALRGAIKSLASIEVILTEVSFFTQAKEAHFDELVSFLSAYGFELYDIAALGGRARDDRLKSGDLVFVRKDSPIAADTRWA